MYAKAGFEWFYAGEFEKGKRGGMGWYLKIYFTWVLYGLKSQGQVTNEKEIK